MPVITTAKPIEQKKVSGKTKQPNEFLAVIEQFNDGATRAVKPAEGEVLSTLLNQLREAARTIKRSVSMQWINDVDEVVPPEKGKGVPTGATAFKFLLRDLITRKAAEPVAETATADAAKVEAVAVATAPEPVATDHFGNAITQRPAQTVTKVAAPKKSAKK